MTMLRKTKILATLGPSSDTPEVIEDLITAGANGFRLNFSHGSHDYFRPLVANIRSVSARLRKPVAILQDLQGPKIRTSMLTGGGPVHLVPGSVFVLTTRQIEGNEKVVSTTYQKLPQDVRAGDRILIDDGAIELNVLRVEGEDVHTEVIVGGYLKERKGINLPGVAISEPSVTEKDTEDARFGSELDVDYIALSFVRHASDVVHLKQLLKEWGHPEIGVIAKIEKPEGVRNLKDIMEVADGVLVARGDLGVEMPAEKVPLIQKRIIREANREEKWVATATQMLESMVQNTKPTRAEASDVANAILDGTDVVMLSQETAIGRHPAKAVQTMSTIALSTEELGQMVTGQMIRPQKLRNPTHGIVHSARAAAELMKARAILVFTQSGYTAELASHQRPPCPIFAFTPFLKAYNQLALVWGVTPLMIEKAIETDHMFQMGQEVLMREKMLKKGDSVVIVSGTQTVRGATNMMKIEKLGE